MNQNNSSLLIFYYIIDFYPINKGLFHHSYSEIIPINTEHSALCKQDINKIINKTISSYRKPNFFWSIIPTFTEYHYVILSLGLPMSKMWIVETLTYIFKETKEKISVEIAMIDMLLSNRSTYISTSL